MGVAAAPALALGPIGWAVFAGVTLYTAARVYQALPHTSSQSRSETKTKDVAIEQCPKRPWSIRVHAQGTMIGGTSGATIGAPPISQMSPISVAQGTELAATSFALIGARQKRNLAPAYEKCVTFIETRPPADFLGSKSFYGLSRDNNRFDVDSYGCSPNLIS